MSKEAPVISYYEKSRFYGSYPPEAYVSGFCNNGKDLYVVDQNKVLLFDYSSTVPKDIIKCPEIIVSAIDSDTVNGNALIVATENNICLIKLGGEREVTVYPLHGIFKLFNSIYYEKNPEYHYVVAVTNPLTVRLIKIKTNAQTVQIIQEFPTIQEFEYSSYDACLVDLSYSTFKKQPELSFSMKNTKPFIEASASGKRPFDCVIFMEDFIPMALNVHYINGHIVVLVGGNGGLLFGYDPVNQKLLFSVLYNSETHDVIQKILFHFDPQDYSRSFLRLIMKRDYSDVIMFYRFTQDFSLLYQTLLVLDNKKFLHCCTPLLNSNLTGILTIDRQTHKIEERVFGADGYLIHTSILPVQLQQETINQNTNSHPLGITAFGEIQPSLNEIELYDPIMRLCDDYFVPIHINIVTEKEWIVLACSCPLFECFSQAVRLLPLIMLNHASSDMVSFYEYAKSLKIALPNHLAKLDIFIPSALRFLVHTNNLNFLFDDLEYLVHNSEEEQLISAFFKIYYEECCRSFKTHISKDKTILTTEFLERSEVTFEGIYKIFEYVHVDESLLKSVECNLFAIRYFLPFSAYFPQLHQDPVITVDGTLITPMIDLFFPKTIHPVSLEVLLMKLFSQKITPSFQLYLHYLFLIHGLKDKVDLIAPFKLLPIIPTIAELISAFDAGEYQYFVHTFTFTSDIQNTLVNDVFTVAFKYYASNPPVQPSPQFHSLASLVDDINVFMEYVKCLIGTNQFKRALLVICDFYVRHQAANIVFWETVETFFKMVIDMFKIDLIMQDIYNTEWEQHFMSYVFKSENMNNIEALFKFYIRIRDVFSSTYVYLYILKIPFEGDDWKKKYREIFQNFVNSCAMNDQSRIKELLTDDEKFKVFTRLRSPLLLEQAVKIQFA